MTIADNTEKAAAGPAIRIAGNSTQHSAVPIVSVY